MPGIPQGDLASGEFGQLNTGSGGVAASGLAPSQGSQPNGQKAAGSISRVISSLMSVHLHLREVRTETILPSA
jgi:hypothetical protein